ncbi:hypothetical protein CYY_008699 [Polysphondylium violaceum]|uniref:EGF-like domain-containing protein n=1 Tax=Polysphondylium violaceum TaxID=133409 RepID=A0A8J4PL73_9MYCE|nr:hypothetical protein CYY_008699 [Polysphondylium violaceum]
MINNTSNTITSIWVTTQTFIIEIPPNELILKGVYIFKDVCEYNIDFSFDQTISATVGTTYTSFGQTQEGRDLYTFKYSRPQGSGALDTEVTLLNGTVFQLNTQFEYTCIPVPFPLELVDDIDKKIMIFDDISTVASVIEFKNNVSNSLLPISISCTVSCTTSQLSNSRQRYMLSFSPQNWKVVDYEKLNDITVSVIDSFNRESKFSYSLFLNSEPCTTVGGLSIIPKSASIPFSTPSLDHLYQFKVVNNICNNFYFFQVVGVSTGVFSKPVAGSSVNSTYMIAYNYRGTPMSSMGDTDINGYLITRDGSSLVSSFQMFVPSQPTIDFEIVSTDYYNSTNPDTPLVSCIGKYNSYVSPDSFQKVERFDFFSFSTRFEFPWGYSKGNIQSCDFSVSFPLNIWARDYYYIDINYSVTNAIIPRNHVDFYTPQLGTYSYKKLSTRLILVTMNITNQVSPFLMGHQDTDIFFSFANLVNGTLNEGTYQFVIDLSQQIFQSISLTNRAQMKNTVSPISPFTSFHYIPNLFDIKNFTNAQMQHQYADISGLSSPFQNKFYFNVTDPHPDAVFLFYYQTNVPFYLNAFPTYHDSLCYWTGDDSKHHYTCDFKVVPNLFTNTYQFYIYLFNENPSIVTSAEINLLFPNSTFNFESIDADEIPPMVSSIFIDNNVVDFTSGSFTEKTVTVQLNITDSVNGLKEGYVIFTSEYDAFGYNFSLNPSLSTNNDIYNPSFDLKLNLTNNCISQTYTITDILLIDKFDHKSTYQSHRLLSLAIEFVNPIYYIEPKASLQIICSTDYPDTIVPVLTNYQIKNVNPIDVGVWNRENVEVEFTVTDSESGIMVDYDHSPMVYLDDFHSIKRIKQRCELKSKTVTGSIVTSATFTCSAPVPHTFGAVNGIAVSLYGIMDNYMNFVGFSSLDLEKLFGHSIVQTQFTQTTPIITKGYAINEFEILLVGYNFYSGTDTIVEIQDMNGNFIQQTQTNYIENVVLSVTVPQTTMNTLTFRVTRFNQQSNEFSVKTSKAPPSSSSSSSDNEVSFGSSASASLSTSSERSESTQSSLSSHTVPSSPSPSLCQGEPVCGGPDRGVCTPSGCKCTYPAIGEDCSSVVIVVPVPNINYTSPSTEQTIDKTTIDGKPIKYSSLVSVYSIQEIDGLTNKVVKEDVFSQWILSDISTSTSPHHYLYQSNFTHNDPAISGASLTTSINVTIQWFTNSSEIQFGSKMLSINANSMKYNIQIDKYPFKSQLNILHIVMKAQLGSDQTADMCSDTRSGNTTDNNQYIQLQVNDHSLYGRFLKTAIIDGEETVISNKIDVDGQQQQSSSMSAATVSILVPYFRKIAVIDPDFSLLLDSKPALDQENSVCSSSTPSSLTKAQLAGIIIGSVGFVAVATTCIVYYFYKRKQGLKLAKKLSDLLGK